MKSDKHKNSQGTVRDYYREKGFISIIEYYINGKKIDVLAQDIKTKYAIANEIQLSPKHFIENILLDFKAGCDEVRIITLDNNTLIQIKEKASSEIDKSLLGRIRFQHIEEFIPHLCNKNNKQYWNTREFNTEFKLEDNVEQNLEERR